MSLSEDSKKRRAVQNLFDSGRVYFFPEETETGFVLTTNLSTAILTCLQDLRNPKRLEHLIDVAMEYPLTTIDTEVLEAISKLRKDFLPERQDEHNEIRYDYNLLALYCFLADMVTIYPNHANPDGTSKTFLQGCRDANLTLKPNSPPNLEDYRNRFNNALNDLGLSQRLPANFIENWIMRWEFDAFGEINNSNNIDTAAYNKLARAISFLGGNHLGVGECICFARGNRDFFEKNNPYIASEPNLNEIMLNRARDLANSNRMLPILVQNGKRLREDKLHQLIAENTDLYKLEAAGQNDDDVKYGKNFMRDLLLSLPLETLQILDKSDYAIAHVNDRNLERIYPAQTLPGLIPEQMLAGRLAAGDTMSRFRLICNSNGLHHNSDNLSVLNEALKQRLIHETAHIAFGNHGARSLDEPFSNATYSKDFYKLCKKFSDICVRLFAVPDSALDQKSQLLRYLSKDGAIKQRTLRDVINAKSDIGTYSPPERQEEMMVECLALAYTEFADPNKPNNIFGNYGADNSNFVEFREALAHVKQLYIDSAKFMQIQQQRQTQQQPQR